MPRGRDSRFFKHGLFGGYADYRYGVPNSRPISLAGPKQEKPVHSVGKRKHLVERLAEDMSEWRSSPFENEGPFRTAIRAALCLKGNPWRQSDAEAAFLVGRALKAIGIPRPSWDEGQPGNLDSPDRCAWCAGDVSDTGNGKASRYCSAVCAKSSREAMARKSNESYDKAYAAAERAILKSRTTARKCAHCGDPFQPIREKSKQRFCSFSCGAKGGNRTKPRLGLSSVTVTIACVFCGSDFGARHRRAIVCSKVCSQAWDKLRKGKEPKLFRPHVFDRYITRRVQPPAINGARFDFMLLQDGATITAEAALPASRITDALFAEA